VFLQKADVRICEKAHVGVEPSYFSVDSQRVKPSQLLQRWVTNILEAVDAICPKIDFVDLSVVWNFYNSAHSYVNHVFLEASVGRGNRYFGYWTAEQV